MTLTEEQREALVTVLTYHQPTKTSGCYCGWAVLGASHPEHVVAVYESAIATQDVRIDGRKIYCDVCKQQKPREGSCTIKSNNIAGRASRCADCTGQLRDSMRRTPTGQLPSNYHDLVPVEIDSGAICPPGEHSYGWESDDATYCECGVRICGHVSVNGADTYICVRPVHEPNVGHLVALR